MIYDEIAAKLSGLHKQYIEGEDWDDDDRCWLLQLAASGALEIRYHEEFQAQQAEEMRQFMRKLKA